MSVNNHYKGAEKMLAKSKQVKEQGFTIIEVLIVLAIAGLIMLIVFLAVPALQRNSRNTQRRNDVSALLSGVSEYSSNNGGDISTLTSTLLTTSVPTAKRSYYKTDTNIKVQAALPGAAPTIDEVYVLTGFKCASAAAAPTAGPSRSVVAYFSVEKTGGGAQIQCQESGA